ncbi:ABC transporter substrate-binding protein [Azonexus sp.]|uniref:ABC transporter substrate-binding protein n=1 Tax=Azonexus sp. TaxID=1872668 RepID=UPI0035B28A1D
MSLFRLLAGLLLLAGFAAGARADCPRIVSQSPYLSAALDWFGRADCLVGVSRYDSRRLPHTGGVRDPDGAAIARLQPDLVIVSRSTGTAELEMLLPDAARLLQVDGLESVDGADTMLLAVGEASRAFDPAGRVEALQHARRALAGRIGARGQRVLVLSACSALPYSYGRGHYVGDAFVRAGFDVVETAPRLRHLRDGEPIASIGQLVGTLRPELIVSLNHRDSVACNAELGQQPVRIVHLTGENFFNPGPRLLDGYRELTEAMQR